MKIDNGIGGNRETSTGGPGSRPGRSAVDERGRESINFFAELKRRNVYKVAVAYIVAGWALSQGIAQVFPVFDIPNWIIRLIVLLIILGLPIALVLAWRFELTPQGIKRTETADAMPETARQKKHTWIYVVVIAGLFSIGLFFLGRYSAKNATARQSEAATVSQKSIAVLPFDNLSRDPDNAYFCEGVQDEILTRLAKVADLKVISRTSTQHFKSTPDNLPQIAKPIADTLQARLTGSEKTEMSKKPTEDPEAYEFYLKGRFFWNKRTGIDLRKAIEYFNQAVARDPNYALAYVGLSDSYLLLPNYGSTSSQEALPPARTAAKKALALDDSLAEAHASLGLLATIELDLERALRELERAVQLKPNYATAHHWLALADMTLARFDPAIAEGKRAIELDPLSLIINADFSWLYLCARRYDEGEAQARKTLEIDPHFFLAHYYLGIALQLKGRLNQAIPEFQKSFDLNGDPYSLGILGQAYARNGQNEEARKILARLNEQRNPRGVAPYAMALVYLGLGDKERAIDELARGYRDGETNYLFVIKVDPLLDELRGDPRFEALMQKIVAPKK